MNRSLLLISCALVAVLLLAGAAYVGGRMLTRAKQANQPSSSGKMVTISDGGGEASTTMREAPQVEPAKELPPTQSDASGIFLRREEHSVFIGTGKVTLNAREDPNGEVDVAMTHDGPMVEVVTTSDTLIYRDVTPLLDNPPAGGKIQQVVEPGTLDDLEQNMGVTVWGQRRGDRVVARVLVYHLPRVKVARD